jgi:hypothetical protein
MLGVNGSQSLADLAYMEREGTPARKVQAAIWAFIWSSQNSSEKFGMTFEPSLNEMREAMAKAIEDGTLY